MYEAIRWLEYAWEQKRGRLPAARELAVNLCELADFYDHTWRRREAREEEPWDALTPEMRRTVVNEGALSLGDLIPQSQIDAEDEWEREEAIILVKPRSGRERRARDDIRRLHALASRRKGIALGESRERAIVRFRSRYKRAPGQPSAWQLREADRIIKRRRKRVRKEADAFRKALGDLHEQPPAKQIETVRRWRRRNPLPPMRPATDVEQRIYAAALETAQESSLADSRLIPPGAIEYFDGHTVKTVPVEEYWAWRSEVLGPEEAERERAHIEGRT